MKPERHNEEKQGETRDCEKIREEAIIPACNQKAAFMLLIKKRPAYSIALR